MLDSRTLRCHLDEVLRTDADLDAFCLDFFPEVHRRFNSQMERTQKINLLFQLISDRQEILRRLSRRPAGAHSPMPRIRADAPALNWRNPLAMLQGAITAAPVMKYVLGVAGLAAGLAGLLYLSFVGLTRQQGWVSFSNSKLQTDTNTGSAYPWPYCKQPCHMLIYSSDNPKEKSDNVTEATVEYELPADGVPQEAKLTIVATMNDRTSDNPNQINDCAILLIMNGHYPGIPFSTKRFEWGKRNEWGDGYFINFTDDTLKIPDASNMLKQGRNRIKYSLKCNATHAFIVIKETILDVRFKKETINY